jgi:hypothetical protein
MSCSTARDNCGQREEAIDPQIRSCSARVYVKVAGLCNRRNLITSSCKQASFTTRVKEHSESVMTFSVASLLNLLPPHIIDHDDTDTNVAFPGEQYSSSW